MIVRRNTASQLNFRFVGWTLPTSTANKNFGTTYVWRVWRIDR
jgi:hypothetical protein